LNQVETQLAKEAYALSKINVEQWKRFLIALESYTWSITERATRAPTTELHVAVGMARQALEFNEKMHVLDTLHEKLMHEKLKVKP
jgi:hypothetical protein